MKKLSSNRYGCAMHIIINNTAVTARDHEVLVNATSRPIINELFTDRSK
jgi:hypothetical protein